MIGPTAATRAWLARRLEAHAATTVRIDRVVGRTYNPATYADDVDLTTVYDGWAKLSTIASGGDTETAGRAVVAETVTAVVPHDTDVRPDDRLTVTASAADAQLVGEVWTVARVQIGDGRVTRRLVLERVTAESDA